MTMKSFNEAMHSVLMRYNRLPIPRLHNSRASRGDSFLEERFWSLIDETEGGRKWSLDQFEIGRHRVDSIFLVPQGAVVIELDGAEFHHDRAADHQRDTELLKVVSTVIRIRYHDLMTFPRSTLFTIGRFYPRFLRSGVQTFDSHDDPNTAQLLGISWRKGSHTTNDIVQRIKKGQRTNISNQREVV